MGLHLYCILPSSAPLPASLTGVSGAGVQAVQCGSLACWASTHDARPAPDEAGVRAHNAVILAAMTDAVTPVPLRFGQWTDDVQAAEREVGATEARWLELLARLAGRAEYGVRLMRPVTQAGPAQDVHGEQSSTGKEYMARLARRQAAARQWKADAEEMATALLATAGSVAGESRMEVGEPPVLASLAHLVAWTDADAYHSALARFRSAHSDVRCLCTGPWPPYSFVA
jgi:hypothetical protein